MFKIRNLSFVVIAILLVVILSYFISVVYTELNQVKLTNPTLSSEWDLPLLKLSFISFLFGILLEWRELKRILKKDISINWLVLGATIILIIISFIPHYYYYHFPWYIPFIYNWIIVPLQIDITHIILSLVSGVLLIRSIVNDRH